MNKPFMPLADLDFAALLNEAESQTATGEALLNRYRQVLLNHEATCTLVNSFIKEAQNLRYDQGICDVLENVSNVINANPVSWRLATACESINANNSQYNYLNRNAAKQVATLLEMNEKDVVTYIKNGALKNVMFCESFRNIVKSVFRDNRVVISEDYTAVHPVSFTEINEGYTYFEVLGRIYKINDSAILEATASEVSDNFLEISRLLESNVAHFENDNLVVSTPNATYTVSENEDEVKCVRKNLKDNEEITFESVEDLREHNRLVVGATTPNMRNQMASILEGLAKAMENFDSFALLSNASIVESKNDKFLVIEHRDHMFAMALNSNHTNAWKVNDQVVEALNLIQDKTHLNLKKDFAKNIEEQFEKRAAEEQEEIKESIEKDAMQARRNKIEALMEQYKGDETKMAVLSKIAEELAHIND